MSVAGFCQGGTSGLIPSTSPALGKDGSVVLAGTAQQESNDFAVVKLNEDGGLLWEWQVTNKPISPSVFG